MAWPSYLYVNLGYVPFNKYDDTSLNSYGGGVPYVNGCSTARTVRSCFQEVLRSYRNPTDPTNGQHVTGVRFFFGMDEDEWSSPINANNTINTVWAANVGRFFADLAAHSLVAVPTPSFLSNLRTQDVTSSCNSGQLVRLSRFSPIPRIVVFDDPEDWPDGRPDTPEGFQINSCYANGTRNPHFVGWNVIAGPGGVLDTVISQARANNVSILEFDMENEVNLRSWPIYGRLIVDNKHGLTPGSEGTTDVLQMIRGRLGYYTADFATYSAAQVNPDSTYPAMQLPPYPDVYTWLPYAYSVHILKESGVLSSPFASPGQNFNGASGLTRAEAAFLTIRSIYWNGNFPDATTPNFVDVPPSHPYFRWINKMRELGITSGCGTDTYCPDSYVTNAQMAVFAVRAWQILKKGTRYWSFPYPGGQAFLDVPGQNPYYTFIQKVYGMQIVGSTGPSCSGNNYCPDQIMTRGDASKFIAGGPLGKLSGYQFVCNTSYGDSGRLVTMSAVHAAITGDYFGDYFADQDEVFPQHWARNQNCSVRDLTLDAQYSRPTTQIAHTGPWIVDVHSRPGIQGTSTGDVKAESVQTFNDVKDLLDNRYVAYPYVHFGETYTVNDLCPPDPGDPGPPPNAATHMINGFNESRLAHSVYTFWNHWSNHTNVNQCARFPAFTIRPPYDPSNWW